MLRVFIGYDDRQPVAYNILQFSIATRSSRPVAVTPLIISQLPIKRTGLTPFTFSRFLVPWLCDYQGVALFLDIDMLVLGDIAELFDLIDDNAIMVSKNRLKFEWASVMLFNCGHPDHRVLTPEYVETAEKLHSIAWTERVGNLPPEWNHLVMYDEPKPAKLVHYTAGIPCFPENTDADPMTHDTKDDDELQLSGQQLHHPRLVHGLDSAPSIAPVGTALRPWVQPVSVHQSERPPLRLSRPSQPGTCRHDG